jgi:hypothetical protein
MSIVKPINNNLVKLSTQPLSSVKVKNEWNCRPTSTYTCTI